MFNFFKIRRIRSLSIPACRMLSSIKIPFTTSGRATPASSASIFAVSGVSGESAAWVKTDNFPLSSRMA